jgi:hypothetical protein
MTNRKSSPRGMVLLIVLGMLALFSLLAVTYVVFASQSRTSSVVLANSAYRGTNSSTLMNQVVKQVVRGTQDKQSGLWGQGLLEDLYGPLIDNNGNLIPFANAGVQVGNWPSDSQMQRNQLPLLIGTQFLRFPFRLPNDVSGTTPIPTEEDSLRSRIITFLEGPLAGMSFRVVRHVTEDASQTNHPKFTITPADPVTPADDQVASAIPPRQRVMDQFLYIDISSAPNAMVTIPGTPPRQVTLRDAVNNSSLLAALFYQNINRGYRFFLNPMMRSGTGYGRAAAFSGDIDVMQTSSVDSTLIPTPIALLNHFGNYRANLPYGGPNEPYDAADYNNFFLSHSRGVPQSSADIIPSFHRPEVINYLANQVNFSSPLTPRQVLRLVQLVDYATARPLSINFAGVDAADYDPSWLGPYTGTTIVINPLFSATNPGVFPSMTPYLEMDLDNSLAPGSPNINNLQSFLRWLAYGPWDVDTDSDGINDAIWIDPNLPLITSPEGKLLKPLVALRIEDFDGKVNINAAGGAAQGDANYYLPTDTSYAVGINQSVAQGFGYGPAELSLFHLFPTSATAAPYLTRFNSILANRYTPRGVTESPLAPGQVGTDLAALFGARDRLGRYIGATTVDYRHGSMPGLRLGTHGEEGVGIDLNGQPLMLRGTTYTENTNSPYETRLLSEGLSDTPYDLEELERVMRVRDRDYSMLPDRLENALGGPLVGAAVRNSVTTRSVDLTDVEIPGQDTVPQTPTHPFRMMVRDVLAQRSQPDVPEALFHELFPFEFRRGSRMNINRAFGDGVDNDDDGQIDEWDEWAIVGASFGNYPTQLEQYFDTATPTPFPVPIDQYLVDTARTGMDAGLEPKQLFARELYCLAQLIVPEDYVFVGSPTANASDGVTQSYRARKLAQWAINVVDYRDADVAMTRFPYDSNPFDGWIPGIGEVVWGMEQPELLLRESLALHNYNVKDTTVDDDKQTDMNDPDPAQVDDDPDQYKVPMGGLYLELFAPRTMSNGQTDLAVPGTPTRDPSVAISPLRNGLFRRDNSQQVYLDLGAMSPPPANAGTNPFGRQPVWRVVISTMHEKLGIASPNATYAGSAPPRNRNDITYQLYSGAEAAANGLFYNLADTSATIPQIERIIWFTTQTQADPTTYTRIPGLPASANPREHIYFNRTGVTRLDGGNHLVIGPRPDMRLGSESPNSANVYQPSEQRFELTSTEMLITNLDGTTTSSAAVKPINGMVVAALPPAGQESDWADVYPEYGTTGGIGISVSEPLPRPLTDPVDQRYYRLPRTQLNSTAGSGYENDPVESWHDFATAGAPYLPDEPFDRTASMLPPRMHNVGTYRDVTTAFLQRLADPEREYDATLNPYITVDWIPIDLTTFSGEDSVDGISPGATITDQIKFTSRSRTGQDAAGGADPTGYTKSTLYTYATTGPNSPLNGATSQVVPTTPTYFDHQLVRDITIAGVPGTLRSSTFGYLNKEFGIPQGSVAPVYVGHPVVPFATHFWLNRQFANVNELMMVPMSHPGQFGQDFTTFRNGAEPNPTDPVAKPFGHLMTFLSSTQLDSNGRMSNSSTPGADMARLLAFLETPPPFVDSTKYLNPTVPASVAELARERAPFNFLSTFQTPGKININTIGSANVWMAIEANYLPALPVLNRTDAANNRFWNRIELSRQGYSPAGGQLAGGLPGGYTNHLHPEYPSQFAGLFRSPWHTQYSPELPGASNRYALRQTPASASLLRSDPSTVNQPLLYDSNNNQAPDRYPFAAYQPLMRMPNLVTTHSNVYSMRMAMGYFEFDQVDGQIGREFRSDVGRNERNHSFFIIDRSIPVGFYPGLDLNSEKTILTRRYFE